MKILFSVQNFVNDVGGAELCIQSLAKKLVKDIASVKKPTEIDEIKQQLDKMPIYEDPFDNNKDSFKSYNFDKSGNSKKNHNLSIRT